MKNYNRLRFTLCFLLGLISSLNIFAQVDYLYLKECNQQTKEDVLKCSESQMLEIISTNIADLKSRFPNQHIHCSFKMNISALGLATIQDTKIFPSSFENEIASALRNLIRNIIFEVPKTNVLTKDHLLLMNFTIFQENVTGTLYQQKFITPNITVDEDAIFEFCDHLDNQIKRNICTKLELLDYLNYNIDYPTYFKTIGLKGRIDLQFKINSKGDVDSVIFTEDELGENIKTQILTLLYRAPKFIPAVKENVFVSSWKKLSLFYN